MYQIIQCECGAEAMTLEGRCVGCNRVRPSSKEVTETIEQLQVQMADAIQDLKRAIKLEKEENSKQKDS